jgi:hypothetical protein
MSDTSTAVHRWAATLRIILVLGFFVACWNFVLMFRGWVVAPQAEVVGANILFVFLGIVPWIGMIAASFRKSWGAWIVLTSPIVALTGLAFTKNAEWMQIMTVMAMTVGPTVIIGAVLLKMFLQEHSRPSLRPDTSLQ